MKAKASSTSVRSVSGLALRLVAAVAGAYALCWTLFELVCAWLPASAATRWYVTGQIAPLPFVGVLLWAFVAPTPLRALAWPLGLAALCALAGAVR
jgi:hypothetical protein